MRFSTAFGIGDGFVSKSQVEPFEQVRQVPRTGKHFSQTAFQDESGACVNVMLRPGIT